MRVEFTKIVHLAEILDEKQIQMLNQLILKDMQKHQFKPFQQVLVRDGDNRPWKCGIFSHYDHENEYPYSCIGSIYKCCIPYNENTAYLLGTTDAYVPPQPKTYQVVFVTPNGDRHQVSYTDDEFRKFIETAVLNNKDVTNFDVRRICG